MRDLNIAYGNSCMAKKWSNKTITFGELCGRLENTIRTTETVEEYQKMKRAEREAAKDKGGFVGGQLKGGRRKRENVVSRSMLTMDVDKGEKGFIESYEMLASYTSVLYTTHGHTPEAPRFRIIIPLMMPSITVCSFLTVTNGFKLYDQNLALTNGAPSNMSEGLALNITRTFYGRMGWEGVGQAKAVLFFILVAVIALIQNKLTTSKEVAA